MDRGAVSLDAGPAPQAQHALARPDARTPYLLSIAAILAIVVIHLDTAWSMADVWIRSETFAHGWVIAPISLWLAWRERERLAQVDLRPWYPALAAVAVGGLGWLLGTLASVNLGTQLGLVMMIQFAVVAVLGWRAGTTLGFPLAFLLFAVPFGDFMVPTLMDWTADVTVTALRLTGIPVYRDGNYFSIPSGQWSVVEACSGLRYLIAAVMAGTLYAYLVYRTLYRRLAFIAASFVIPIIANWLRAYIIVMLGHLSGNRLAAGVDHLIYGWVFFGIVIFVMFWVGSRWREDGTPARAPSAPPTDAGHERAGRSSVPFVAAAVLVVAVAGLWKPVSAAIDARSARGKPSLSAIQDSAGWQAIDAAVPAWQPHFVGASAALHQTFEKEGRKVGLVIAYYRNQSQGRELVSSVNVLVREKDPRWREVSRGAGMLAWAGSDVGTKTSVLRGHAESLATHRFYWIDGRYTASDTFAKAMLALTKLLGGTDDSAIVVVYTPIRDDANEAKASLDRFTADMAPIVARALSAARER